MTGASILVVEDEKASLEIISRYLTAVGHSVTGAGSAEEALRTVKAGRFDLIMLDVVLPGETGLQVLARLRAMTKAPVYIMSGYSDEEAQTDALLLGATGFFGKPLDLNQVAAVIQALPGRA